MWERFSYFTVRFLLVLFLTSATIEGGFGWSAPEALRLYGFYAALVYVTPVIGGWLSDKIIGIRLGILIGGVLMMLGHFSLGAPIILIPMFEAVSAAPVMAILNASGIQMGLLFPPLELIEKLNAVAGEFGHPAAGNITHLCYQSISISFYLGLTLIILGNGLYKPNISTLVGYCYHDGDLRKDSGYTIFYLGINIGAFFAGIIAGTVGEKIGWHYGFTTAGFGMIISLSIFLYINQAPNFKGLIEAREAKRKENLQQSLYLQPKEIGNLRVLFVLWIYSALFWAAFEQMGGLLNLFAFEQVERRFLTWEIPATWFQSLNPLFIALLAPIFSAYWNYRIRSKGTDLAAPIKFFIGMLFIATAFLVITYPVLKIDADETGRVGMVWLVIVYFLMTMGELAISPVGLAAVNKASPPRFAALMMGFWWMSFALANFVAGQIGALASYFGEAMIFAGIAVGCFFSAFVLYRVTPVLIRWSHYESN